MNGKQVRLASISGQPLLLSKGRYNLRKLHELPVQLIRSQRWDELKNEVLCNFYWLKTKIEVRSLRWGKFFWSAIEYWVPWPWMKARLELNFVLLEISLSYAYELHRGFLYTAGNFDIEIFYSFIIDLCWITSAWSWTLWMILTSLRWQKLLNLLKMRY